MARIKLLTTLHDPTQFMHIPKVLSQLIILAWSTSKMISPPYFPCVQRRWGHLRIHRSHFKRYSGRQQKQPIFLVKNARWYEKKTKNVSDVRRWNFSATTTLEPRMAPRYNQSHRSTLNPPGCWIFHFQGQFVLHPLVSLAQSQHWLRSWRLKGNSSLLEVCGDTRTYESRSSRIGKSFIALNALN